MVLSPENPRFVEPEIETSHAEEFVEGTPPGRGHSALANQY